MPPRRTGPSPAGHRGARSRAGRGRHRARRRPGPPPASAVAQLRSPGDEGAGFYALEPPEEVRGVPGTLGGLTDPMSAAKSTTGEAAHADGVLVTGSPGRHSIIWSYL